MKNAGIKSGFGFTLVELLVAMMVTSIILTTLVTFSFGLSNINESSEKITAAQSKLRYTTLRLTELISNSRLICSTAYDSIAIWSDDSNGDGQVNANELVFINRGSGRDHIELIDYPDTNTVFPLHYVVYGWVQILLNGSAGERKAELLPNCDNVTFYVDKTVPNTEYAAIGFGLEEDGVVNRYEICSSVLSRSSNLVDGYSIVSDDD